MAEYTNDLRLKEIATGDESGTWGTSTNTNLELIAEAFSYSTVATFDSDADKTETIADGSTDPYRSIYVKVTSGVSLTATRTLTIAPNTVSKIFMIENATSGSQSIAISQGSGANVTIPNGDVKVIYTDGAGAGAAVVDAFANLKVTDAAQTNITSVGTLSSLTVSGDLTVDTDTLYVDSTNNRVGIGTGSPSHPIHVSGASGATQAFFNTTSGNTNFQIQITEDAGTVLVSRDSTAKRNLSFNIGDDEVMRIDTNDRVGIGTTSPSVPLEVNAGGGNIGIKITDSDANAFMSFEDSDAVNGPRIGSVGNDFIIQTSLSERVRVDSTGDVGIGTSSPSALLHVAGDARIGASGATSQLMGMVSSGGVFEITTSSAVGKIHLARNVGIGTSSPDVALDIEKTNDSSNTNVPTLRFTDADTSSAAGQKSGQVEFFTSDTTPGPIGVHSFINGQTEGTSGLGALVFGTGQSGSASEKVRIDSSGNVLVGKTSHDNGVTAGIELEPNGQLNVAVDGSFSRFNRLTSDGTVIDIRKDNTTVGVIGTQNWGIGTSSPESGTKLAIHDSATNVASSSGRTLQIASDTTPTIGLYLSGSPSTGDTVGNFDFIANNSDGDEFEWTAARIDSYLVNALGGARQGGMRFYTSTSNGQTLERIRIDESGNVGIGTTDPDKLLHLEANNSGAAQNNTLRFTDTDTATQAGQVLGRIEFETADTNAAGVSAYIQAEALDIFGNTHLTFGTGTGSASEAMRIGQQGFVGIGTSPSSTLHIQAADNNDTTFTITGGVTPSLGSNAIIKLIPDGTSGEGVIDVDGSDGYDQLELRTGGTTALTIDGSQNVGIGTTSPAAKLTVSDATANGLIKLISGDSDVNISFEDNSTTDSVALGAVGDDMKLRADAGNITFFTDSAGTASERMRITDSGNVGIGTSSPGLRLDVSGNAAGYLARFINDGGLADRAGLQVRAGADSGAGTTVYFRADDGDGDFTGELKTVSGVFQLNDVSDERLKQDIVDTSINGLEAVNNMRIVDFAYKKNPTETIQAGFIAQELQQVFAPAVSESTEYEESAESYLSVSRERLVPVLVKAIQEQQEQIESLKSEIELLKGGN